MGGCSVARIGTPVQGVYRDADTWCAQFKTCVVIRGDRLAPLQHDSEFVLKGAALIQLWTGQPHRSDE